jgi:hypothetical protein
MERTEAVKIVQAIRDTAEMALCEGSASVFITVLNPAPPTTERIHLAGHGGPFGKVTRAEPNGSAWKVTALFPCASVIVWANRFIRTMKDVA